MQASRNRRGLLRLALALLPLILLALSAAGVAFGDAGGGSGDYGGGGGGGGGGDFGGGGGSDFGGGDGSSGGGGSIVFFVLVLGGILAVGGSILLSNTGKGPALAAQLRSGARRRLRRGRVQQVELAAAEAAEDDERFAPERVRSDAEQLFRDVQAAWDERDEARLATLVGPDLLVEWKRHLAGLARKGWHNRVEVLGDVQVDYVGLTNREGASDDRVVVLIDATPRDYVENRKGKKILRKGESDDTTQLSQYWTLGVSRRPR
ncbi:MAG TPA: TIM44-like domain-containing protein [Gaiellaceae bacterium]